MTKLCLSLTESTIAENVTIYEKEQSWVSLVELRADFLLPAELEHISNLMSNITQPCILSLRAQRAGGYYKGSDEKKTSFLLTCIQEHNISYVEIEEDYVHIEEILTVAVDYDVTVIRLQHVFTSPEAYVSKKHSFPKYLFHPENTSELFLAMAQIEHIQEKLPSQEKRIITGEGAFGFPLRILAGVFDSFCTYCSHPRIIDETEMYSHILPEVMSTIYHVETVSRQTEIFGLIGDPLDHTASPQVHNTAFNTLSHDCVYIPFTTDNLALFLKHRMVFSLRALSVTMPFKREIIPFLNVIDNTVLGCNACNTVTFREDKILGWNTDVKGFLHPLKEVLHKIHKAVVIGAGGTARSATFGLKHHKIQVTILNRTLQHAQELAEELGVSAERLDCNPAVIRLLEEADVIVQATGVGMGLDTRNPLPFYTWKQNQIAYDVIYEPERTMFLRKAEAGGAVLINGEHMLHAQAKLQQALFFDIEPEEVVTL